MAQQASEYRIGRGLDTLLTIRATSPEEAARRAARRFYGGKLTTLRTTGEPGHSGNFAAYRTIGSVGGLNKVGESFHVY